MRCFATRVWLEISVGNICKTKLNPVRSAAVNFLVPGTLLLALAIGSLAPSLLQAQQIYRIVGPDGRVTFSDRSPTLSANGVKTGEGSAARPPDSAAPAGLPYELRQVALKYPVVLHTAENCAPCAAGRAMLASRGVPFSEKTVMTVADKDALQRLSGGSLLPFLTLGSQKLNGFSGIEWTDLLSAAGYPKSSALPSGYRLPAPAPLVAVAEAPAGDAMPAGPVKPAPAERPAAAPVGGANPSSIRF